MGRPRIFSDAERKARKNAHYHAKKAAMTPEERAELLTRANEATRRYYASHAEEVKAKAREHWAKPEIRARELARQKARWESDPEHWRAYSREARLRNIDTHKAANKRWVKSNRPATVLYVNKRRARKKSLPDTFTLAEEAFSRAHFHYACAACGNEEGFAWHIVMDHWMPLASRTCPGTIATNMIPLCNGNGSCNSTKHTKDPEPWLIDRFGTRKAAIILKKIHAYFALVTPHKESR
jgi:hypothetical protein